MSPGTILISRDNCSSEAMRRILLADGLVELAVEAKADDAGAETEAVQVSVSENTDQEEPDEYYKG